MTNQPPSAYREVYLEIDDLLAALAAIREVGRAFDALMEHEDTAPQLERGREELQYLANARQRMIGAIESLESTDWTHVPVRIHLQELRSIGSAAWVALRWGDMDEGLRQRLQLWIYRIDAIFEPDDSARVRLN